jgi:hypothetical protein
MPKRRVFRTRAKCPGLCADLGPTSNQHQMIGRAVTLEKSSGSEVNLVLDGVIVGQLDTALGSQVASAIERGQSFTAAVEKAYPTYDDKWQQTGAQIDIKVEYLLGKDQPAIETPKSWWAIESSDEVSDAPTSFFTKIAGVTYEGRQRIVARCSEGETLILVRDPNNHFDKGAIKVMRLNGQQLGFIPADVSRGGNSSGLAFQMDHGTEYQCRISSLTGGGDRSLGVNIEITEGQFDNVSSVPRKEPIATQSTVPMGWLLFASVGVILLIVVIIMHS